MSEKTLCFFIFNAIKAIGIHQSATAQHQQ
jgi:hypothetical protein